MVEVEGSNAGDHGSDDLSVQSLIETNPGRCMLLLITFNEQ